MSKTHNNGANTCYPNTYQKPNFFTDELMHLLTPEENVVLDFAVRRILGFDDHRKTLQDCISLTQFVEGIFDLGGTRLCWGTGLGRPTIVRCIQTLTRINVLVPVGQAGKKGQKHELNLGQCGDYDLEWLEERLLQKQEQNARRTAKAREKRKGQQAQRLVEHTDSGMSDIPDENEERLVGHTDSGMSDIPEVVNGTYPQNQQKPTETQGAASAADGLPRSAKSRDPMADMFLRIQERDMLIAQGRDPPDGIADPYVDWQIRSENRRKALQEFTRLSGLSPPTNSESDRAFWIKYAGECLDVFKGNLQKTLEAMRVFFAKHNDPDCEEFKFMVQSPRSIKNSLATIRDDGCQIENGGRPRTTAVPAWARSENGGEM